MLKTVLLVRHAQSDEDINPNIRNRATDSRISVTVEGKKQIAELVRILGPKLTPYNRVKVVTSSATRAKQTALLFCSHFEDINFEIVEVDCIRNLNWGSVDENTIREVEQERYRIGVLYFQFPGGDYTPDFVREIEEYVTSLLAEGLRDEHSECVVIFTHGFALRVIAKAFLGMSNEDFRYLSNPLNCYVATVNVTAEGVSLEKPLPRIKFDI